MSRLSPSTSMSTSFPELDRGELLEVSIWIGSNSSTRVDTKWMG